MDYLWNGVLNHDKNNCSMCHVDQQNITKSSNDNNQSDLQLWNAVLNHNQHSCSICRKSSPEPSLSLPIYNNIDNVRRDPMKQRVASLKLIEILKKTFKIDPKVCGDKLKPINKSNIKVENVSTDVISNLMTTSVVSQNTVKAEIPACLSFTSELYNDDQSQNSEINPASDGFESDSSSETVIDEREITSDCSVTHQQAVFPTPLVELSEIQSIAGPSTFEKESIQSLDLTPEEPIAVLRCHMCDLCREPFDDWDDFNLHKQMCGLEFPCPCPTCGNMVPNQSGYMYHLDFHKKLNYNFKCGNCNCTFATNGTLRNHIRLKRPCNTLKTLCKFCGKLCINEQEHESHVATCDKKRQKYMCDICSDQLGTRASLARHIQLVHEREQRKNDFVCHHCGKTFSNRSGLNKHMMKHADRKYKCFECGRKFIYFSNLKYHMRIHLREMKNME